MAIPDTLNRQLDEARRAQQTLAAATGEQRQAAVRHLAEALEAQASDVDGANRLDLENARQEGLAESLVARLAFGAEKARSRAQVLRSIADLPEVLGRVDDFRVRGAGLRAGKRRAPLGVVAMIYEARPHVTVNAGALCLRAGNASLLKGGREAEQTNRTLHRLWTEALTQAGLPPNCVQMIEGRGREVLPPLLAATGRVDLVIPRGGAELIATVTREAQVPVVKHFQGNCHVYVDTGADLDCAVRICVDGKVLMPEVCNATETVLVAAERAPDFLPALGAAMEAHGVELRAEETARRFLPKATAATEDDWRTEYLDLILAVKVVADLSEAIAHINHYGSQHTEAIVSPSQEAIERFMTEVDSGVLLANASTMFCDGATLGMGAEIGISTDKLHARGPMGLEELTTYKWVIYGDGQIMGS